jgi:hypothetical protein
LQRSASGEIWAGSCCSRFGISFQPLARPEGNTFDDDNRSNLIKNSPRNLIKI